jgi:glycine C-acetyltransferase
MKKNHAKKKMVVTEGVFSITGEIPNLKRVFEISKEHDALTVIDDAHGDFIYGYCGSGTPSYLNANSLVDVHVSSLSKGLGSFGGYVATTSAIREFLVNKSRQFIFTSALPNYLCRASIAAIKIATRGIIQEKLFANIRTARTYLMKYALHDLQHRSQIIPIQIGDEDLAWRFAEMCLRNGLFVYPMRFPSVKKGSSVIRLSLTALHTKTQLLSAFKILQKVRAELISV